MIKSCFVPFRFLILLPIAIALYGVYWQNIKYTICYDC